MKGFIDFHSFAQLWMSPWGYTKNLPPDFKDQVRSQRLNKPFDKQVFCPNKQIFYFKRKGRHRMAYYSKSLRKVTRNLKVAIYGAQNLALVLDWLTLCLIIIQATVLFSIGQRFWISGGSPGKGVWNQISAWQYC